MELKFGERCQVIRAIANYCLTKSNDPAKMGLYTEMALKLTQRYPVFGKDVAIITGLISQCVRNIRRRKADKSKNVPQTNPSDIPAPSRTFPDDCTPTEDGVNANSTKAICNEDSPEITVDEDSDDSLGFERTIRENIEKTQELASEVSPRKFNNIIKKRYLACSKFKADQKARAII